MKGNVKTSRTIRKAMAFVMAAALTVSSLVVSPSADAASKKAPKLAKSKKTLYYNKSGKKSFTLKLKKNKAKIKSVTWKTSKKSVAKLSKKKKTSVKVTAKKKGTAKIKAVVKYTLNGKSKKKTLTCTVKSKKYTKSSGDDSNNDTENPTQTPDTSATPTQAPTEQGTTIALSASSAAISTAAGKNTVTLKATVKVDGKEATDKTVTWTSSDEKVATVKDGVVTAVKEGKADITATVDTATATCKVTVDATAPKVKEVSIQDYKTIKVTFDEAVKGEASVKVTPRGSVTAENVTAALAEDGLSMTLTDSVSLKADNIYDIIINGLTDLAGNDIAKDTTTSVTKAKGVAVEFACKTVKAPTPNASNATEIYVSVKDQYGETFEGAAINANIASLTNLSVTAKIKATNYPLVASFNSTKGCVEIAYDAAMTNGKEIGITLVNKVDDKTSYTSELTTVLEYDKDYKGQAVDIAKVNVAQGATAMKDEGNYVYTMQDGTATYELKFTADLLDKYLYDAAAGKNVKYVISDTTVLAFVDNGKDVSTATSGADTAVTAYVRKPGTVKVTAYLMADDAKSKELNITINPVALSSLGVANANVQDGVNGEVKSIEITAGANTALKVEDLKADIASGASDCDSITFRKDDKTGKFYVDVKAKTTGKVNTIVFSISAGTVKSGPISFTSQPDTTKVGRIAITPFDANELTVGGEATTDYSVYNIHNENISALTSAPHFVFLNDRIAEVVSASNGKLTVKGVTKGSTRLTLDFNGLYADTTITVSDAAALKTVELSTYTTDVIAGDAADVEKAVKVTAKNQFGFDYKLTRSVIGGTKDDEVTVSADQSLNVKYYYYNATDKKYVEITDEKDSVNQIAAITVDYSAEVTSNRGGKVEFTSPKLDKDGKPAPAFSKVTLGVTVTPTRKAAKLEFDKATMVSAVSEVSKANALKVIDQYGKEIAVDGLLKYNEEPADVTLGSIASTWNATTKKYDVTAGSGKAGTYTIAVYADLNKNNKCDSGEPTASYSLVVGVAQDLVASVKIDKTVTVDDEKYAIGDGYKAYTDADSVMTLTYTAYDKDGNEVKVDDKDFNLVSWKLTAADGKVTTVSAGEAENEFKVATTAAGSVTAELIWENNPANVKDTLTIPVDCASPTPKTDTYKIYLSTDDKKADVKNGKGTVAVNADATFVVAVKDQYGKDYTGSDLVTNYLSGTPAIATVSTKDGNIVVHGVAKGNSVINVTLKGEQRYTIDITVS